MEKESISKHYADVANRYDDLFRFTYDYIADFTIRRLKLQPDDRLVDIVAGTGAITSLIWTKSCLNNPILCVDPSIDMLKIAEKKKGLKTCPSTADDFFGGNYQTDYIYNKLMFLSCANLFQDPYETFRSAFEYLPANGLLVVVQRSTECTLPLWKSIYAKSIQSSHTIDGYRDQLERAGFQVTLSVETGASTMTKREWYDKLRKRMFTVMSGLSDEEIEEGIREVDREWFCDKEDGDNIEIKDTLVYFVGLKVPR